MTNGAKKNGLRSPGIEPGSLPWQGSILPLDHERFTDVMIARKKKDIYHNTYLILNPTI